MKRILLGSICLTAALLAIMAARATMVESRQPVHIEVDIDAVASP